MGNKTVNDVKTNQDQVSGIKSKIMEIGAKIFSKQKDIIQIGFDEPRKMVSVEDIELVLKEYGWDDELPF